MKRIYENISYTSGFKPENIEDTLYKNCKFFMADAARIMIKNCEFENCNFKSANFEFATIAESTFTNCDFASAAFKDAIIKQCEFNKCDLSYSGLGDAISLALCKFGNDCTGLWLLKGIEVAYSHENYKRLILKKDSGTTYQPSSSYTLNNKPYTPKAPEMVDPHQLPNADYYRSTPSKVEKSKKHPIQSDRDDDGDDDDVYSEYGCEWLGWSEHRAGKIRHGSCGYWRDGTYVSTYGDEKYQYGYMDNAVLECSAIEEFEKIEKHVRPVSGRRRSVPLPQE